MGSHFRSVLSGFYSNVVWCLPVEQLTAWQRSAVIIVSAFNITSVINRTVSFPSALLCLSTACSVFQMLRAPGRRSPSSKHGILISWWTQLYRCLRPWIGPKWWHVLITQTSSFMMPGVFTWSWLHMTVVLRGACFQLLHSCGLGPTPMVRWGFLLELVLSLSIWPSCQCHGLLSVWSFGIPMSCRTTLYLDPVYLIHWGKAPLIFFEVSFALGLSWLSSATMKSAAVSLRGPCWAEFAA